MPGCRIVVHMRTTEKVYNFYFPRVNFAFCRESRFFAAYSRETEYFKKLTLFHFVTYPKLAVDTK